MFDTEKLTMPLWDEASEPFGYRIPQEVVVKTIGISSEKARAVMIEEYGEEFPYDKIRDQFRLLVKREIDKHGVPKKPGLDFLLERLCAAKIPMSLATSSRRATALDMLERAGIISKFTAITGGDEVANGKPAPDIFLLAAEKIGIPPNDCIGFEDSPAGLRGLHAAGIRSIFIKDVIEPPQEVLDTVWRRYGNLAEAAELFNTNML